MGDKQQSLFQKNSFYNPHSFKELDGRSFYNDFARFFDGHTAVIETNFKTLGHFKITFDQKQLVHLLGLQKVTKQSVDQILTQMKDNCLDFRKISRNPNFYQIRPRLYNYGFLHDIFYDELYLTVVSTKMLKPNTQHLDALFFKPRNLAIDHHVVLGLRKVNENDGYVPVTLHEVKSLGRLKLKYAKVKSLTMPELSN